MADRLEDLIGERLVIGFPGTRVTDDVIAQFRATNAGGVIFYRINFESPDQLRRLISTLENALQRKLLVCVDHENGRVVMYRDGVTIFPDNLAFGRAGDVAAVEKAAAIAAAELRALGTDVNFAPVVDILTESYSPNIGIRSFGEDRDRVGEMGAAYIRALQKGGVSATAKHFPGKGHAGVDAHLRLPTITSDWTEMNEIHLRPFVRAIEAGVDVIMSSHPRYPRLDPANITTFSRRIITDCLRGELAFKGVIASDDLEMGAIREVAPIGVAAVKAAAAGHDLLLSCHDFDSERRMYEALLDAYKGRLLPLDELEESVERIRALKAKRPKRFEGPIGPAAGGAALAKDVAARGLTVVQDPDKILPLSADLRKDVGIVFPKLSNLAQKIMVEKPFENEDHFFLELLAGYPEKHVTEIYNIDPDDDDIENAENLARRSTVTLFFCFDAHLHPREQVLFAAVQRASRKLVVIFLRDPWDRTFLRPKDVGISVYGWRRCQIEAAVERIYGRD